MQLRKEGNFIMNKYETVIIINDSLTEEQKKDTIKNIEELLVKMEK